MRAGGRQTVGTKLSGYHTAQDSTGGGGVGKAEQSAGMVRQRALPHALLRRTPSFRAPSVHAPALANPALYAPAPEALFLGPQRHAPLDVGGLRQLDLNRTRAQPEEGVRQQGQGMEKTEGQGWMTWVYHVPRSDACCALWPAPSLPPR